MLKFSRYPFLITFKRIKRKRKLKIHDKTDYKIILYYVNYAKYFGLFEIKILS